MSNRMRALVVLAAVFLLGCMVGAAGFLVWGGRVVSARGLRPGEPFPRGDRPFRLVERLGLSHDQESQVRQVLDDSRKKLDAIRAESAPRLAVVRAEMDKKILALLNDEQKKKFEEFRKEMESRRGRMHRRTEAPPNR
ncbi:MAG TPA: hypothetical protein VE398_03295 [Acidobacteriota bacterium]|nr:hypothetical protein [Acidobacteriota bacterium]